MARLKFVLKTISRYINEQHRSCPNCGNYETELIGRKKLLLEIRRCRNCLLMFRYPKDEPEVSADYYQNEYKEGMTTDLPDLHSLNKLMEENFHGCEKDLSEKIEIVKYFKKGGRILDYGCSWGYGVYQLKRAGFDAIGYEISSHRASYGIKYLDVKILKKPEELLGLPKASFDIIFTNHVLEHISKIDLAFNHFQYLIKRGGILVIFVPNGSVSEAMNLSRSLGPIIGEKHPVALDVNFFAKNLIRFDFHPQFGSSPYDISKPDTLTHEKIMNSSFFQGSELLVFARYEGD